MEARIAPKVKFTITDVRLIAEKDGPAAAADWLLLISPGQFDGDYYRVYDEMKRGSVNGV